MKDQSLQRSQIATWVSIIQLDTLYRLNDIYGSSEGFSSTNLTH